MLRVILRTSLAALLLSSFAVALTWVAPKRALAVNATLSFAPATSTVGVNANDAVDITVANVTNMGGYDLSLSWNPAVVQLTSLSDANIWAGHTNVVICDTPSINNTTGQASTGCATFMGFNYNMNGGVTTTNALPLLHAAFKGVAPGSSSLDLSGSALQHPDATAITPVTLNAGSITVVPAAPVGGVSEDPDLAALRQTSISGNGGSGILLLAAWAGIGASLAGLVCVIWLSRAHLFAVYRSRSR